MKKTILLCMVAFLLTTVIFGQTGARLKKNIKDIQGALQVINAIQPRRYQYKKSSGQKEYGFIAQELLKVYPQAVSGSPDSDVTKDLMMVD